MVIKKKRKKRFRIFHIYFYVLIFLSKSKTKINQNGRFYLLTHFLEVAVTNFDSSTVFPKRRAQVSQDSWRGSRFLQLQTKSGPLISSNASFSSCINRQKELCMPEFDQTKFFKNHSLSKISFLNLFS